MAWTPVFAKAITVGPLSAQLRRPSPRSATSAIRRLRPFDASGARFLLGTNLPREYEIARATYGWTEDVLRDLARTSIEAAGPDIKEKMRGNLSEWGTGSETFDEKRS